MRALLDENMPKALIRMLTPEIDARTVQQEGWSGRANGDLLTVASKSFDVFITDQGVPHGSKFKLGAFFSRVQLPTSIVSSPMSTEGSKRAERVVSRDPEVLGGALVFAGTRVPVQTLIDYLKAGETLDRFLEGFPTVEREQAEAYLEMTLRDAETHA